MLCSQPFVVYQFKNPLVISRQIITGIDNKNRSITGLDSQIYRYIDGVFAVFYKKTVFIKEIKMMLYIVL
jgi:hypothetical protein